MLSLLLHLLLLALLQSWEIAVLVGLLLLHLLPLLLPLLHLLLLPSAFLGLSPPATSNPLLKSLLSSISAKSLLSSSWIATSPASATLLLED